MNSIRKQPSVIPAPNTTRVKAACQPQGQTLTSQEALSLTESFHKKYLVIGCHLGMSINVLHAAIQDEHLGFNPTKAMEFVLKQAQQLRLLTPETLTRAMELAGETRVASKVAGIYKCDIVSEPAYRLAPGQAKPNQALPVTEAALILKKFTGTSPNVVLHFAVDMGLPLDVIKILLATHDYHKREEFNLFLLEELQQHDLLTYDRLCSAADEGGHRGMSISLQKALDLPAPIRRPDFHLTQNKEQALMQPLSFRDFCFYAEPFTVITVAAWHHALGTPQTSTHEIANNCSVIAKIQLYSQLENTSCPLTINDLNRALCHPNIHNSSLACKLAAEATGQTCEKEVNLDVLCFQMSKLPACTDRRKALGLALGLSSRTVLNAIQGTSHISPLIIAASEESRLTPENIVYALETSGLHEWLQSLKSSIPELCNVSGKQFIPPPLPYLTAESATVAAQPESLPLTDEIISQLPPDNWYWIGLAMGVSSCELKSIYWDSPSSNSPSSNMRFYRMIERNFLNKGYETGHLHHALTLLNDDEALKAFPAHMAGEPSQPLDKVVPRVKLNRELIKLAGLLAPHAEIFGQELGFSNFIRSGIIHNYDDRKQAIIELIEHYKKNYCTTREEAMNTVSKAAFTVLQMSDYSLSENVGNTPPLPPEQLRERAESEYKQMLANAVLSSLEAPEKFICPLSLELIEDPVYLESGPNKIRQAYERKYLVEAFRNRPENPLTRAPIEEKDIHSYPALKDEIQTWMCSQI